MTVSWANAQGVQTPERKEVDRLKIDTNSQATVRLIGNVLPRYVYWITTTEGRRMPVECLEFIRDTESFDPTAKNPFSELPEEVFNEKPQFAYVCNVFDRGSKSIKLFDLKRTILSAVLEYARNPDWGNPADLKEGYDITIKKEKTGPLPQNVKYTCIPSPRKGPLTEEEAGADLYDLEAMFKRQTYDEQKQWLIQNTTLFANVAGAEMESAEDLV